MIQKKVDNGPKCESINTRKHSLQEQYLLSKYLWKSMRSVADLKLKGGHQRKKRGL